MSDTENTQTDSKIVQNKDEAPEWARREISEANAEAAKYRVKAQTTEAEVTARLTADFDAQLKTVSDEKSAALVERDNATANYDKLVAALGAEIPGGSAVEFAKLLQGTTLDDYKAHAANLKEMFGTGNRPRAVDPSQGRGESNQDSVASPLAQLLQSNLKR